MGHDVIPTAFEQIKFVPEMVTDCQKTEFEFSKQLPEASDTRLSLLFRAAGLE